MRLATASASRVIVAAHHQAGKGGARDTHLAWNWSEIKQVLVQSGCVQLYLAGHDHMGGHTHEAGIHWLTVEALLEGERLLCLRLQHQTLLESDLGRVNQVKSKMRICVLFSCQVLAQTRLADSWSEKFLGLC